MSPFLAIGAALALGISLVGLTNHVGPADIGVVLGTTVEPTGRPSPRLQARLQKTADLYNRQLFPIILVSGGLGKEGFNEAVVMKNTLIELGIPAQNILMDSTGNTTYRTAKNAAALMRDRGLKSAFLVSQFFHLPRTRWAFHRFGVATLYYAHANFFELRDVYSLGREIVGWGSYALRKYR